MDGASAIAVDSSGNVIVAGYTDDGITGPDFLILKYSGAGVPSWTNRYDGGQANAIAVAGNGSVFVTGSSGRDFVTIKYDPPIWLYHQIVGNQLVLSWINAGLSLESAPAVQGPYTTIRGATSSCSTDLTGTERYCRLKGN